MGIDLNGLMQVATNGNGWMWQLEANNLFTVRSLRKLIDCTYLPPASSETEWSRWIPGKINIHIWRVKNNRLATKDNLHKRGITSLSDECPMCLSRSENLDHVFAQCSTTKGVIAHISAWLGWWPVNASSAHDIWSALDSTTDNLRKEVSKVIKAAFFWIIWTHRNGKVFNGTFKNEKEICGDIQFLAFDWIRCRTKNGKFLKWESWLCNPADAVFSCTSLASR